jgi:hypothetical protein
VWYERLEPLAASKQAGPASAQITTRATPVVYRKDGINNPGFLVLSILIPN